MDPNITLKELRDLVYDIEDADSAAELEDTARLMATLFDSLDTWLTRDGALPAQWNCWSRRLTDA